MDQRLLKVRRIMKAKKPKFVRQDAHKKVRLAEGWRRPKGLQSKVKDQKKGHYRRISVGFGSPAKVRGASRDGFMPVMVSNVSELKKIGPDQAAVIPRGVGQKKRAEIVKRADELSIKILNIKNSQEYLKSVIDDMKDRKEKQQTLKTERQKKKAEKEKKAEEKKKEDLAEKLTDEEKKADEKKERDRVLTKKEN